MPSAGDLDFFFARRRGLRTNWLIVGIENYTPWLYCLVYDVAQQKQVSWLVALVFVPLYTRYKVLGVKLLGIIVSRGGRIVQICAASFQLK